MARKRGNVDGPPVWFDNSKRWTAGKQPERNQPTGGKERIPTRRLPPRRQPPHEDEFDKFWWLGSPDRGGKHPDSPSRKKSGNLRRSWDSKPPATRRQLDRLYGKGSRLVKNHVGKWVIRGGD